MNSWQTRGFWKLWYWGLGSTGFLLCLLLTLYLLLLPPYNHFPEQGVSSRGNVFFQDLTISGAGRTGAWWSLLSSAKVKKGEFRTQRLYFSGERISI